MASIIKNQILKHFSRFAKNVSPDQISVEVLRGKGELYNIELNEDVLTDVLEFPSWVRIQKAVCSRIIVKIPWTRLKTHPVLLFIDEVRVELVLSAEIHHAKFTNGPTVSTYSMDSSYGFAHRVVEGITIRCNAVEVFFTSQKFGGSLMLSQISVESRTPFWKEAKDLRETRITDSHCKQILLFKQISWKTLRLEASTLGDSIATGYNINAPLRLITSQGRCRFITKKSTIGNGSVFRGRLALILDNLLWVASLSQVQSAISFFHFVMDLIRQSSATMETEINKDSPTTRRASSTNQQQHQQYEQQMPSETNAAFQQFNVIETSFHCYIAHIDLHICDESKEEEEKGGDSSEDLLIENGAMQVTLKKLVCDFYPYHPAGGSRKHWIYYQETMFSERTNDLLKKYKEIIKTELSPSSNCDNIFSNLMSLVCVFRLQDIFIFCVTDPSSSKHKTEKFLSTDLPPSSSFLRLHPVRVFLDLRTIRWINYVFLKVNQSLFSDSYTNEAMKNALHKDIYMDVMMPRVIVPLMGAPDVDWLQKVPTSMVLHSSRICLTNCLPDHSDSSHQLQQLVTEIEEQEMPIQADDWDASLPSNSQAYSAHVRRLVPKLDTNQAGSDCTTDGCRLSCSSATLVEKATVDVWRLDCTPLWLEFQGKACQYPEARPLMFDCNFTVWLMMDKKGDNENILYSLADTVDPVKVCLDHYQYLFVTYAMNEMSRFSQMLYEDTLRFTVDYEPAVCFVHFQAPSIQLYLLLPPNGPLTVYDNEKLSAQSTDRQFSKLKLAETVDTAGVKSFWDERENSNRSNTFREICQNDTDSSPTDEHSVDQVCKFESDAAYSYEESGSIVTNFSNDDDDDEQTFIVVDHREHSLFDEIFSIFNSATVSLAEEVVDCAQNSDLIQKMSNQVMCAVQFTLHRLRLRTSFVGLLYRLDMCSPVITVKNIEKIPYRDFCKLFSQKGTVTVLLLYLENDEPTTLMSTVDHSSTSDYSLNVTIKNEQINLNLCLVEANVSNVQMHLSSDNLANLSAFVQDYSSNDQLSQMRVKLCLKNVQLSIFDPRIPDPVYILLDSGCILQGKMAISTLKQLKRKSEEIENLRKENATLKKKLDEALKTIENANKK
ncbi:UHRF1-binding protein 1-like [Trichinella pseudospiralis]|uniref:UHRF1-binding protein 1-like n=1 Tax=Trichinella pseudospiralis TaxID=6337 RepID=A0A0V1ER31_TRIPS|nr:UHRF1-binding protein 1-like [Trichinella pseudospiralis]